MERWNATLASWGVRDASADSLPRLYGDSDLPYEPQPAPTSERGGGAVRLCILAIALAIIARVALLPGWTVPVPALLLTAELAACVALVAGVIHQARPPVPPAQSECPHPGRGMS
jgi:hypothetical protein